MRARPVLLAAFLIPAAAVAQGFEYAPSTSQYHISSKTHGSQEAMGQKNEFDTSNEQLLTVTVARQTKDTMNVTVTIDSLNVVGPMGMTPPGLDKLKGAKIATKMAPHGVVYSAMGPSDDSVPQGAQITDELSRFLPRIRTRLAAGATWTDTTKGKVKQQGIDLDRQTIARFTVVGDTTVGAQKAWKISRETTTNLSGSGTAQGQPMTMEGTSNGKGTLLMSQSGVFLGGQNQDDAIIKIVLAANGMEIGVTTTANTTVEKIK
ncbi:MAG TPA: hypothetical protein VJ867_14185 [Gemmatimonadaceae bacterium]|nr:hypothetical protein [Gemmatimonadaceae bacterium]